jgi:hypothetical protein
VLLSPVSPLFGSVVCSSIYCRLPSHAAARFWYSFEKPFFPQKFLHHFLVVSSVFSQDPRPFVERLIITEHIEGLLFKQWDWQIIALYFLLYLFKTKMWLPFIKIFGIVYHSRDTIQFVCDIQTAAYVNFFFFPFAQMLWFNSCRLFYIRLRITLFDNIF